ncbi:hypothetical protein CSPX01_16145 [Colletotrichum filicis]|nr:hypothetical protein CSPX01_16145 [Colletotrichum filicis]
MKRLPSDAPTVSTGTTMESLFRVQALRCAESHAVFAAPNKAATTTLST